MLQAWLVLTVTSRGALCQEGPARWALNLEQFIMHPQVTNMNP